MPLDLACGSAKKQKSTPKSLTEKLRGSPLGPAMPIYFPIAELSLDVFMLLALGGGVGFLSGVFGVGGGFLLTPLLLMLGVPPAVAVSTQAPQILASSMSGMMPHWRRGNVDLAMGAVLIAGGVVGSLIGVQLFAWLRAAGQIDLAIALSFVFLLGSVGGLMLVEATRTLLQGPQAAKRRKLHEHGWFHNLPFKVRFRASRLYISVLPPLAIGIFAGVLTSIMGVGGGFFLVPAMIFLLGMPTIMAVGTSLFQIIAITGVTTVFQAVTNYTVDVPLALVLAAGGVIGAQWGANVGQKLKAEQLRALFALLVLGVAVKLGIDLALTPDDLYSIAAPGGG